MGKFLRVRVRLNINQPLTSFIRIKVPHSDSITVMPVLYERLPIFCFKCGRIGHVERECEGSELQGETEVSAEPREFGSWMRAAAHAPENRQHWTYKSTAHRAEKHRKIFREEEKGNPSKSNEHTAALHRQEPGAMHPYPDPKNTIHQLPGEDMCAEKNSEVGQLLNADMSELTTIPGEPTSEGKGDGGYIFALKEGEILDTQEQKVGSRQERLGCGLHTSKRAGILPRAQRSNQQLDPDEVKTNTRAHQNKHITAPELFKDSQKSRDTRDTTLGKILGQNNKTWKRRGRTSEGEKTTLKSVQQGKRRGSSIQISTHQSKKLKGKEGDGVLAQLSEAGRQHHAETISESHSTREDATPKEYHFSINLAVAESQHRQEQ